MGISMIRENSCLDEEILACFVDSMLTRNQDRDVKLHLARCQDCIEKAIVAIKVVHSV